MHPCTFVEDVRVRVYAQDKGSYVASRRLQTINYELQRQVFHHNSKNTASATKVVWQGYWPLLFLIVSLLPTMSALLRLNVATPKTSQFIRPTSPFDVVSAA